jgi:alpha-tubulin suppressor-like RCC1 family protein
MGRKILLAGLIIASVCGVSAVGASALTPNPTITSFSPSSATVGTEVTIDGTHLTGATEVTFDGTVATVISDHSKEIEVYVPVGATTGHIKVRTPGGAARSASDFTVLTSLDDAMSVVSVGQGQGYCALLASGGVDCWGLGNDGELGNGTFSNSDIPVAVEGAGGTGTLTGVTSLAGTVGTGGGTYCALLTSGGVDCWGLGSAGEVGSGTFSNSDIPVAVEGVGGTGTLTGVTSLLGEGLSFCALMTSDRVDCWGYGYYGELGNGIFYTTGDEGSATPVEVKGVGGTGTLTRVTSLFGIEQDTYCGLVTSGRVDCWGYGYYGELGNGIFYTTGNEGSATPVEVKGVGGTGTLTEVTSIVSGPYDYCALLTSAAVDCWGYGESGQIGNGSFNNSDVPAAVEGIGGSGTLNGVKSLAGGYLNGGNYCALLTSGAVDCWGYGFYGQLGNDTFSETDIPVAVEGVGGTGTLTGVTGLFGGGESYCAQLTSGGDDCWGFGADGDLGDGTFYTTGNEGSPTPVEVDGVGGTGTLTGVTDLVHGGDGYCALLTSAGVDCWGYGYYGELGNGTYSTSSPYGDATPVEVE